MNLLAATRSILSGVEQLTGRSVLLQEDDPLQTVNRFRC
jgi:hypothetical protein